MDPSLVGMWGRATVCQSYARFMSLIYIFVRGENNVKSAMASQITGDTTIYFEQFDLTDNKENFKALLY